MPSCPSLAQTVDVIKCKALKSALESQRGPWIVSVEQFFDGNDDPSSIGWNLPEHPGMDRFRDLLIGLLRHPEVQAVYARIVELDPGEFDCWPAADIIFVVGTILADELRNILNPLEPYEVCSVSFAVPEIIKQRHRAPVVAARWG
jgi:hypothetical protein